MLICTLASARRAFCLMHGLIRLLRSTTSRLNSALLLCLLCQLINLCLLRRQDLLLILQNLSIILVLHRCCSLRTLNCILILLRTTLSIATGLNMLRSLPISHPDLLALLIKTELLGLAHRSFCCLRVVVQLYLLLLINFLHLFLGHQRCWNATSVSLMMCSGRYLGWTMLVHLPLLGNIAGAFSVLSYSLMLILLSGLVEVAHLIDCRVLICIAQLNLISLLKTIILIDLQNRILNSPPFLSIRRLG